VEPPEEDEPGSRGKEIWSTKSGQNRAAWNGVVRGNEIKVQGSKSQVTS